MWVNYQVENTPPPPHPHPAVFAQRLSQTTADQRLMATEHRPNGDNRSRSREENTAQRKSPPRGGLQNAFITDVSEDREAVCISNFVILNPLTIYHGRNTPSREKSEKNDKNLALDRSIR